jgi:hypothetical protein
MLVVMRTKALTSRVAPASSLRRRREAVADQESAARGALEPTVILRWSGVDYEAWP